jgi:hypothetical protein
MWIIFSGSSVRATADQRSVDVPVRPLAIVASVVLSGVLLVGALPAESAAESVRARELHVSGAWSWFGDPRAVYHEGAHRRTYVGWVDRNGHIQVASYDHDTRVRVLATLKANFQIDDHANPSTHRQTKE